MDRMDGMKTNGLVCNSASDNVWKLKFREREEEEEEEDEERREEMKKRKKLCLCEKTLPSEMSNLQDYREPKRLRPEPGYLGLRLVP